MTSKPPSTATLISNFSFFYVKLLIEKYSRSSCTCYHVWFVDSTEKMTQKLEQENIDLSNFYHDNQSYYYYFAYSNEWLD